MSYDFDFGFLADYWMEFVGGAWLTAKISLLATATGFVLGTALAISRTGSVGWLRGFASGYVEIVRNTPLIVQTFWIFFGLASLGIRLPAFLAAVLALTLNVGAYSCEIIRAGIETIRKGQLEAAESLGLSRARLLLDVVLPPAIERVFPALSSQYVLMMLASSIMAQISAEELMAAASRIQSDTFRGFEVYIVVAAIYVVLALLFHLLFEAIARLAFRRRRRLGTPL
jgi:polar amino acid transport system permease protein